MGKIKEEAIKQQNDNKYIEQITDDFMETWYETLSGIIHSTIPNLDANEMEVIYNKVCENLKKEL
jgi:uncharacterized membrane-anchored protein YjiN (DUF445 family)